MRAIVSHPPAKPSALESLALASFKSIVTGRDIEEIAQRMGSKDDVLALHQRATAPVGTTTASGFASQLMQTAFGQYLATLQGSAAARIISLGMSVPMGRSDGFAAPTRNTAPATLPWVGESAPIPVRTFDFQGLTLTPKKMAAISVLSRELAKRAGGEAAVRQMLREDGEVALDAAYFSATSESASDHPGLLEGLTAINGYGGGDLQAFQEDISAILTVIGPRNSGSIVYVTGMATVERIALKFPDFRGTVLGSQAVADTTLIGVDAGNLVHSFGDFDIDTSTSATVHMSDTPAEIVADNGTVADPTRSVFQTDCVAIRIIGDLAFGQRKADTVAVVENITW
ncbi:MAG: hypothetical protein Devi2KO_31520 [Devosia indica]